jgi:predicted DNA-binding protein (UPF0251 family)
MPESQRPFVRDGSRLTYDELQRLSHAALRQSEYTQQEMADRLDVNRATIGKAVTRSGSRYQRLQMRIVEALTDYRVEREETVRFRTWRQDPTET